jgi:tetrahydromethanopterin S-methyltransferase subunit G
MNFRDDQFWKGVLLGAAAALLVTNDTVQKAVMKGTASVLTAAQSGVEEVKEKFEDVKAEIQQKTAKKK